MDQNFTCFQMGSFESLAERDPQRGKFFLGQALGLTGCEVSLNRLPAGKSQPFVHSHKRNEELYIVLRGKGRFFVDGNEFPVQEGSLIRIAPSGARTWKAGDEDLYFICIQADANSLKQATREDGLRLPTKASWMTE